MGPPRAALAGMAGCAWWLGTVLSWGLCLLVQLPNLGVNAANISFTNVTCESDKWVITSVFVWAATG